MTATENQGPGRPKSNTVTVNVGEKEFTQDYTREDLNSVDELLALIGDPKKAAMVIDHYNYGHDLKLRAAIRTQLLDANAGPEKALAKLAGDIMKLRAAMGKPISEERAMEKARAEMASAD